MAGDQLTDSANNQAQHVNPEARGVLSSLAFNQNDQTAVTTSTVGKYAEFAGKGLLELPRGIGQSLIDDITNPVDTAKMVLTSAAMGVGLKLLLPESGSVGKLASMAIGGYFLIQAGKPVFTAVGEAGDAKTVGDLNKAANDLGMAGGSFVVNSGVGMLGYRLGAGVGGKIMDSQALDGFAQAKANFWNGADSKFSSVMAKAPMIGSRFEAQAENAANQPHFKVDGDKATLLHTEREAPKNAKLVGDGSLNGDDPMQVTVMAQTKGSPLLMDRYIKRISEGAAPLTDAQIIDKFGTDAASKTAIEQFAAKHGLEVTEENLASGRMMLKGTTAQMQQAFGTNLQKFQSEDGVTFRGREGALSVDSDVAPHIKAVLGLDNRPQFKARYVKLSDLPKDMQAPDVDALVTNAKAPLTAIDAAGQPKPLIGARAMDATEALKAYGADAKFDGTGMTTGYLSLGGDMPSTWVKYMQDHNIDPNTFERRVVTGANPTPDPNGADGENALDGVIHKTGLPKAKTVMVQAANDDSGMPNGIDRITFPQPGESQVTHASISWGMYEDGWTKQALAAMDDAGKRAALKGITITVAAGDNGVGDGSPSHKPQVDIPAGLTNFTAAGGTALILKADGTYGSEKAWSGEGATGGGRSEVTAGPPWQAGVKMPDNLSGSGFDGRGVSDLSWVADPRTGINTPLENGIEPIGGTSAAAPGTAVEAAIISQGTKQATGFWNPTLYQLGKTNPEVFHDVTVGNNTDSGMTGYKAAAGWDPPTGWGSINIAKYIDVMNAKANRNVFQVGADHALDFVKSNQYGQGLSAFKPANLYAGQHLGFVPFFGSVVNDQQTDDKQKKAADLQQLKPSGQ